MKRLSALAPMFLAAASVCLTAAPAHARGLYGLFTNLGIHNDGSVTLYVFGQSFDGPQILVFAIVLVGLISAWFLYQHVILGECNCFCGPGKCECGCGCRFKCPCYYRNKEAHSDAARHTHYGSYY